MVAFVLLSLLMGDGLSLQGAVLEEVGAFEYLDQPVLSATLKDSLLTLVFEQGETMVVRVKPEDLPALRAFFRAPDTASVPQWITPDGDVYFDEDLPPYRTYVGRLGYPVLTGMLFSFFSGIFSRSIVFAFSTAPGGTFALAGAFLGWRIGERFDREQTMRYLRSGQPVPPGKRFGLQVWYDLVAAPGGQRAGLVYDQPAQSRFSLHSVFSFRFLTPQRLNPELVFFLFDLMDEVRTPLGDLLAFQRYWGWGRGSGLFVRMLGSEGRVFLGAGVALGGVWGEFQKKAAWGADFRESRLMSFFELHGELAVRPFPRKGFWVRLGSRLFWLFLEHRAWSGFKRLSYFGGVGYAF